MTRARCRACHLALWLALALAACGKYGPPVRPAPGATAPAAAAAPASEKPGAPPAEREDERECAKR